MSQYNYSQHKKNLLKNIFPPKFKVCIHVYIYNITIQIHFNILILFYLLFITADWGPKNNNT